MAQQAGLSGQLPPQQPIKEETLLSWSAPERPFKKRDREYYTTIGIIVFLVSIILFFAGQFLPIAVVVSFAFLSYVLASVPPSTVTHAITNKGLRTGEKLYGWENLGRFWFTTRFGQDVLNIEHNHAILTRLIIMMGDQDKEAVTQLLEQYLVHETPKPTWLDNSSAWLQKKFPLEKTA
jgi:hypothetical protein